MELTKWIDVMTEEYLNRYVRVVLFPTPPTPVDDRLFMPDCFSSKTFDISMDREQTFHLISMLPTRYGPAVLADVKLSKIISVSEGKVTVHNATCCATITYSILMDQDGLRYADTADIKGLRLISRSCHPGSHFVVPMAPYLSSLLHYSLAPEKDLKFQRPVNMLIEYMHPDDAQLLFNCDFSGNLSVDKFVSKCFVDHKVSFVNVRCGLGRWAFPYIRKMRRNILLGGEDHEQHARTYEVFSEQGKEDGGQNGQIAICGPTPVEVHR
jgi:hypothetical protein